MANETNFIQSAVDELKKVHPPTRQETIQATVLVLFMIVLFAIFLGATDLVVGAVMQRVLT